MGIIFGTQGVGGAASSTAKGAIRGTSTTPMTLFSRYMFRQVTNAFLLILLTLTLVVWLATALKELNLITSQGQGILLFFQMTMLSLPSLMALIAPNAMLMAALYTLDRMNSDSELIVMTACGRADLAHRRPPPRAGLARLDRHPARQHLRNPRQHARPARLHHPGQSRSDLASPSARPFFQPRKPGSPSISATAA